MVLYTGNSSVKQLSQTSVSTEPSDDGGGETQGLIGILSSAVPVSAPPDGDRLVRGFDGVSGAERERWTRASNPVKALSSPYSKIRRVRAFAKSRMVQLGENI